MQGICKRQSCSLFGSVDRAEAPVRQKTMGCTQSSFYIDDRGRYWDCQNLISAADVPRDWAIKTQGYGAVNSWLKVKLPRYCYVTRVRLANSFFGVLQGEWKTHKIGISNHYN